MQAGHLAIAERLERAHKALYIAAQLAYAAALDGLGDDLTLMCVEVAAAFEDLQRNKKHLRVSRI